MRRQFGVMVLGVVIGLGIAYAYFEYMKEARGRQQVTIQLSDLQIRVAQLENKLRRMQETVRELEDTSVKGVMENANRAIIDGWTAMMATLESELERARETVEQKQGARKPRADSSGDSPAGEAGSGTPAPKE